MCVVFFSSLLCKIGIHEFIHSFLRSLFRCETTVFPPSIRLNHKIFPLFFCRFLLVSTNNLSCGFCGIRFVCFPDGRCLFCSHFNTNNFLLRFRDRRQFSVGRDKRHPTTGRIVWNLGFTTEKHTWNQITQSLWVPAVRFDDGRDWFDSLLQQSYGLRLVDEVGTFVVVKRTTRHN